MEDGGSASFLGEEEEEEDEEYEGMMKKKNLDDGDGGETRHNPNDHYGGAEELPKREVSETDHVNAKLLASFDKLLAGGAFKMHAHEQEEKDEWK